MRGVFAVAIRSTPWSFVPKIHVIVVRLSNCQNVSFFISTVYFRRSHFHSIPHSLSLSVLALAVVGIFLVAVFIHSTLVAVKHSPFSKCYFMVHSVQHRFTFTVSTTAVTTLHNKFPKYKYKPDDIQRV